MNVTTEFMILELPQPPEPGQLIPLITQELAKIGVPLRWAITEQPEPGVIRIEAVVTPTKIDSDCLCPVP